MEAAHTQSMPVQFHTGYGDSDANLILADPLLLAPLMRLFPEVPVVMLHGAYPVHAQARRARGDLSRTRTSTCRTPSRS